MPPDHANKQPPQRPKGEAEEGRIESDRARIQAPEIILLQDTRESLGLGPLFKSPYIVESLTEGDYSVAGLTDRISIERKSLPDLVSSLTQGRARFERELARARPYHFFAVVVEATAGDILAGKFGLSKANPASICESIAAFSVRYCPFLFCGDRETTARLVESILLKYAREHIKAVEAMDQAARKCRKAS
jgi:DNA excision repair protein ERCC-4